MGLWLFPSLAAAFAAAFAGLLRSDRRFEGFFAGLQLRALLFNLALQQLPTAQELRGSQLVRRHTVASRVGDTQFIVEQ